MEFSRTCTLLLFVIGSLGLFTTGFSQEIDGIGQTGRFTTSFAEKHPLGKPEHISKRFPAFAGLKAGDPDGYNLEDEEYRIFVPNDYDPNKKYGLFVFISAGMEAWMPYEKELPNRQMLGIAAGKSGNDRPTIFRARLALDAVHNMKMRYNIDDRRVIVAGFSGGGRVSSHMAMSYPDIFAGAIYFCGCNPQSMLPFFSKKDQIYFKENNRYVFFTGETDFNRKGTKSVFGNYQASGFKNCVYIEEPGLAHKISKDQNYISQVFDALDKPLIEKAEQFYNEAKKQYDKEKLGRALFFARQGFVPGVETFFSAEAEALHQELEAGYQAACKAIDGAIAENDFKAADKLLRTLKKDYKEALNGDDKFYKDRIKEAKKAAR